MSLQENKEVGVHCSVVGIGSLQTLASCAKIPSHLEYLKSFVF